MRVSAATPSARPHVLMTTDAVGGVWTYAIDLGREMVRTGGRVTLAVIGPAPDSESVAQAQAAGLDLRRLGGELDWTAPDEAAVSASAAGLANLVAELQPHLLHLHSPALAAFRALPVPVLAACHSCVATWWSAVKGGAPLPPDLAWRARLTARGYAAAAALIAPSHAFAEATRAIHQLSTAPHVVLNGRAMPVDGKLDGGGRTAFSGRVSEPPILPSRRRRPSPSSSKGVETDDAAILTAGRLWDEGKDIRTLDRAAGRLADVEVAAAGSTTGPNGQGVILQHVSPLGRLSGAELSGRLANRPIFVSSSVYEPFGLAVLEAAQAGCPLVLSDIATFRELWDGAALFFPPGDDDGLAAHLNALVADTSQLTAMGEEARIRAGRYTASAMAAATLKLYARLSPAFAPVEVAA